MTPSDIIGVLQTNGGVIGVASLLLSLFAIAVSYIWSRRTLINQNSWQTYQMYNSKEIRQGRAAARSLGGQPGWQSVRDGASYSAFFRLADPEGSGPNDPVAELHRQDRVLHYLLNYYHQVGMLLQRNLLDRDFTMLLVGEGLRDRWETVSRIPTFYSGTSYQGMFELYDSYLRWERGRGRKLMRSAVRQRAHIPHDELMVSHVEVR